MTQHTTFEQLGREYQLDLFHEIITDHKFGESIIDMIEPKYFQVEAFQKLSQLIRKYYEHNETILNFPNLRTEINIQVPPDQVALKQQLLDTVTDIEAKKAVNQNVQGWALRFCKLHSLKNAVNKIKAKLDKGIVDEYDTIEQTLKEALTFKDLDESISVYDQIDDVLSDDYRQPIPTGIRGIDEITKGGLSKGELALVIAPLGVGKTTFLTKVASTAYETGYNVLQIFFEDKAKAVQRKHFTLMSGIPLSELGAEENRELVKAKIETFKKRRKEGGNLFLQKLPADGVTVAKLKNIIKKHNGQGNKIDLLVLDYVDCLSFEKESSTSEEWSNEGKIMRQLEVMIEEMDVACWTATQGNRSSTAVEVVKTENMGGNLKKAQIAHLIMSIGKSLDQKVLKVATISILKNRMGEDGMVFQNCKFDNGTLEIDTADVISEKGFENAQAEKQKTRQREMYEQLLRDRENQAQPPVENNNN